MTAPSIRDLETGDLAWVLALNQRFRVELSSLTPARLAELAGGAAHARVAGPRAAFLLAFDHDADYDSPNFLWFRDRLERFLYVDRIVVDPAHQGRGIARGLYRDLFERARASDAGAVVCEVNSEPRNPASDAFHAALGFGTIGEARLAGRGKTVRYLRRALANA